MKNTTALASLALLVLSTSCSSAPTEPVYYCAPGGGACREMVDGWDAESARADCESFDFGEGVCPHGGLGNCTVTVGTRTTVIYFTPAFGDGSLPPSGP
jgi:hypothetical protein